MLLGGQTEGFDVFLAVGPGSGCWPCHAGRILAGAWVSAKIAWSNSKREKRVRIQQDRNLGIE